MQKIVEFRITGRIGQSKYKVDGHSQCLVDLIADAFAILAKARGNPANDEAGCI